MQASEFQPGVAVKINITANELSALPPDLRPRIEAILQQNEQLLNEMQKFNEERATAAQRDALTGCANREAFNKRIEMYLRVMRRFKTAQQRGFPAEMPNITVATLALPAIQEIRKFSGHKAMDVTLKEVAQFFDHHLRPDDFLARIAIDQFAIVMTTAQDNAHQALRRLRREFEKAFTAAGQEKHYLSFHYGACQIMPQHVTLIQILQQCMVGQKADQAHLPASS